MTHPSRNAKRKIFRRKMWARVFYNGWVELRATKKDARACNPSLGTMHVIPVMVTEIPPKPKRKAKK